MSSTNLVEKILAEATKCGLNKDELRPENELRQILVDTNSDGHLRDEEIDKLMALAAASSGAGGKLSFADFIYWLHDDDDKVNAPANSAGKEYLSRYRILEFTSYLVEQLQVDKPEDPYELICKLAASWRSTWLDIQKSTSQPPKLSETPNDQVVKDLTSKQETFDALIKEIVNEEYSSKSQGISSRATSGLQRGESPWEQDSYYQGAGIDALLRDGRLVKPVFDAIGEGLATKIRQQQFFGQGTRFVGVPVKGRERAAVKTAVAFLGDSRQLTDVIRGTLCLDLPSSKSSKSISQTMYQVLNQVMEAFESEGHKIMHFDDRYQRPLGDYRDWLFLVKVQNYICELQVNVDVQLEKKEGQQHATFERERKARDNLLEGTMKDNLSAVRTALSQGASVKIKDKVNHLTPLHYAAASGNLAMVELLLDEKADIFAVDSSGMLPISRSGKRGGVVFEKLLSEMTNEKRLQPWKGLGLSDGCRAALAKVTWQAIQMKYSSEKMNLVWGLQWFAFPGGPYHTLMVSIASDFDHGVELMLVGTPPAQRLRMMNERYSLRSDIQRRSNKCAALDEGIIEGSSRSVKTLLEFKAEFHPDGPHSNPLEAALLYASRDHSDSIRLLIEATRCMGKEFDCNEVMNVALDRRSFKTIEVLLAAGVVMPQSSDAQERHLKLAAGTNNLKTVNLLLRARAEINHADDQGRTALWWAAAGGHADMISLLCKEKAEPNVADAKNQVTAVAVAAFNGFAPALKALAEANAHLHVASDDPSFTLQGACVLSGRPGVLQALQDLGIDLSKPFATTIDGNDFGQREPWVTMAHFAAAHSQRSLLMALHSKGVKILEEKPGVPSVLKIAADGHRPLTVHWLKELAQGNYLSHTDLMNHWCATEQPAEERSHEKNDLSFHGLSKQSLFSTTVTSCVM